MEGNDKDSAVKSNVATPSNDSTERRKAKNKKKSKSKKVKVKKPSIALQFPPRPATDVGGNEAAPSVSHNDSKAPQKEDTDFDVYAGRGITKLTQGNSRFPRAHFKCGYCEYFCDDLATVDRHLCEERHKKREEAACFIECLLLLATPPENILRIIDRCLTDAIAGLGLTLSDYKIRNKYKDNLNKKISSDFPGCYFELYGSSLTRFGFKNSNINFSFNVPPKVNGPTALLNLKSWLEKQEEIRDVTLNVGCELPLITFRDRENDFSCDVALNNTEAVKLSELLSNYGAIDDRVLPLGITFRHWAEVCKLASQDDGGLPKHAFAVMTVFYLQHVQPPVLPLAPISAEKGKPSEAQWGTKRTSWESRNKSTVGELWLGLLKFFSVRYPLSDYIVRIDKRGIEKSNGRRKIIIEDPFQPKMNIARTVISGSTVEYFLHCMRITFKYFSIPNTADGPIYHHVIRDGTLAEDSKEKEIREEMIEKMLRDDERFNKKLDGLISQKNASSSANTHSNLTVTVSQAHTLNCGVNEKCVSFNFSQFSFTGGKKLPLVCTFCMEDNHTKKACPLNRPDKLVQMTADHIMTLDRVCEYVLENFSQTQKQIDLRKSIVMDLEQYISKLYPNVKLELFGSSCNGFGLQNSDLDICLTLKGNDTGMDLDFVQIIEDLFVHLKGYKSIRNLVPITSAKVPIIKFNHFSSELDGDISIYNVLAQNNTRLLKVYSDIDIRVKILGYVMKRFAKLCNICDASRGSLSSYAYILLVIYFLQQCEPPVLPVLQELPEGRNKPEKLVEGWNVYFYDDIDNLQAVWPNIGKNKTSVGSLWCELLNFYAEKFDFKSHVVSVRQKEPLLRFTKMWTTKCMAIEDPFDLNHNLASGLSKKMHLYIIKAFKKGQVHFRNSIRGGSLSVAELEVSLFKSDKLIEGEPPNNRSRHMRHGNGGAGRRNKNKKSEEIRTQKSTEVIRSPVKQGGKFEQAISYGRVVQPFERNPKDTFHGKRNRANHAFGPNTTMAHPADVRNWRQGSGHRAENMVQSRVVENSALKVNMNGPLAPQSPFHFQLLQRNQQQMNSAFPNAEALEQRVEILGNKSPSRKIVDISHPSRR
ncbi:terminal uridylyltransferase 7-like [Schistocerca gregaria]|uniref:terminal uridylyltransferase 7-like n=1 Tax=Schistocerca gregaria TaxID=7010 RepID=UPI00211DD33C|nr:terminal uridylyltransferase 7-like [Schistocerca gregaria]XP_049844956.1 terminal uridylyltransferase 7-like [Schistocerca gregaria]